MPPTPYTSALLGVGLLTLAACGSSNMDVVSQVGPNPPLPAQQQYLLPPMKVAGSESWTNGAMPAVAPGLKITALADGFAHPRSLYVLPNGDVLVVASSEPPAPINRPKEFIMGFVQKFAGAGAKGANRITLLRDTNGDGKPDVRTIFIDKLSANGELVVGLSTSYAFSIAARISSIDTVAIVAKSSATP